MNNDNNRIAYWIADEMITSLAQSTNDNINKMLDYQSGLRNYDNPAFGEPFVAGVIDWTTIDNSNGLCRLEALMVQTIKQLQNKSIVNIASSRTALIVSTTKGNIDTLAEYNDIPQQALLTNLARKVADTLAFTTEPIVISNACISGVSALIVASRLIEQNQFDDIIVVGGDILTPFVVSGFMSFKSVSPTKCRPYDINRDGLSLGEACGAVHLSANINTITNDTVCVLGGAITNDANHISGPSRTGDGLYNAIQQAISECNIDSNNIAFVNAHGTATIYNDEMESKALALANLTNTPTNSLKPYFGHTLGACGVIESIVSVWQLRNQTMLGTMGFEQIGTPHNVNVSAQHTKLDNKTCCLKIASGFGGCNVAMILSKGDVKKQQRNVACSVKSLNEVEMQGVIVSFHDYIRKQYAEHCSPNMKFYKMDDQCKLGYVAVDRLLKDIELPKDTGNVAIILSNKSSSLDTDYKYSEQIKRGEAASPAVFVYTLPNIVSGEICIKHKLRGENTFFIRNNNDSFALQYAEMLLHTGRAEMVICGWCDFLQNNFNAKIQLLTK